MFGKPEGSGVAVALGGYIWGMRADHLEVEDTYDASDDADVPDWRRLSGVATVSGPTEHRLEATYFDTTDMALLRAGVTLRRRAGGDDAGWHLKLPTRRGRHEAREPLGRAVKTVPKPYRAAVRLLTRDRSLAPVATLRTTRRDYELAGEDGAVLARLSDDHVTAELPSGEGRGAETRSWREWELEAVAGDDGLLERAAAALAEAGVRPSPWRSKLARALDGRCPAQVAAAPPRPRRKGPACDLVAPRIAGLVTDLRRYDPLVRRGAPDAVHRMRVAVRRLRSALATYRPLLDREVTEPLRDELKWLGRRLGEARDAEVLHARFVALLYDEPPATLRGRVRRLADEELGGRVRTTLAGAQEVLAEDRYFELADALEQFAIAPPWTERATRPVREVLRHRVRHDWKRLLDRVAELDAVDAGEPSPPGPPGATGRRDAALHEVRKAAKRARYAAEPMAEVYGKPARRYVSALKRVQAVLGEHHDTQVGRTELLAMDERAGASHDSGFTLGVLYAREEHRAQLLEERFAQKWREASRKRLRSWLS